jgi:hypothetical protein
MSIDRKIIEEIARYNKINNYIVEQDSLDLPELPDEGGETPPADGTDLDTPDMGVDEIPEPVDVESDPDVEEIGDEAEGGEIETDGSGTEELDVTELVKTQQNMSEKQDEYMEDMMSKLTDLTSKLGEMDQIVDRINAIEDKIEKYRTKTPEEKLQLRSLDSYPYNQKLTDFFMDKSEELEKTGKNEYVLTDDEVENYSEKDVKDSFDKPFQEVK